MKKILYFGNLYHAEASLAMELNAGSDYKFIPVFTHSFNDVFDNDFKPYFNFKKLFNPYVIIPDPVEMAKIIDKEKPNIIIDRCWVDFANYPPPGTIFWKIESSARSLEDDPLPMILPVSGHAAFLTFNHVEVPEYKKVLGIPVSFLPYSVSTHWDKPLAKTMDVMVTGTCANIEKIQSYELLTKKVCETLPKGSVNIYAHCGANNLNWVKDNLRPLYYAEQSPILMAQAKIFISPVTTRFDPGTISHKTLQAMGCRTLVLTQHYKGVEDMLGPDGQFVIYADSQEEALKKVIYYLKHDYERDAIAQRAYTFAHGEYNGTKVFKRALKDIGIE